MKFKIGVDIDNVISDSYPEYLSSFNAEFQVDIRMDQIRDFYFLNKHVEGSTVKKGKEMVAYIDKLTYSEAFQMKLKPVESAASIIQKWTDRGYLIHFITSRPAEMRDITRNWLKKHGFWVKGVKLELFDKNLGYEIDVPYKSEMVKKYALNAFIEDSLEIAQALSIPVFLMDRPWNQGKLKKNIIRVMSFKEIEEKLPIVLLR